MADLERMESALRNAHKAGDTAAAKKLANALKAARSMPDESQPDPNAAPVEAVDPYADRARRELDKMEAQGISAITVPSIRLPFNDNISAFAGAIPRMLSDQVGPGEAYERQLAFEREREKRQREQHPTLSMAGDIAGGVAAGGGALAAGKGVASVLAPHIPKAVSSVGSAVAGIIPKPIATIGGLSAEGAVWGAGMKVDEANGENVADAAKTGAIQGAIAAPLVYGGAKLLGKTARGVAGAVKGKSNEVSNTLNSSKIFKEGVGQLSAAKSQGAALTPEGSKRLIQNMKLAAGKSNKILRKNTMGFVKELDDDIGTSMSVDRLHELRQEIGTVLQGTKKATDRKTLMNIMDVMDKFIDNPAPNPAHFKGSPDALKSLREGINTMHRGYKTEMIEKIFDLAEVKSGQYSQSGMQNALRAKFSALYTKIVDKKVKGFTNEEIALVRQLAAADTSDQVTKIIARFAPRGPVATGIGVIAGGQMGGPVGAVLPPLMGGVAARGADKAAIAAAQNLQRTTAGIKPPANFQTFEQMVRPVVPAASGGLLGGR